MIEVTLRAPPLTPVCSDAQDVCKDVLSSIVNSASANPHIDELRRLIQKPQFKVSIVFAFPSNLVVTRPLLCL